MTVRYSLFAVVRMTKKLMYIFRLNKQICPEFPKKSTSSFEYSVVLFIIGCEMLTCSIKSFKDSFPCFNMKNISFMYLYQIFGFFSKVSKSFLKTSHEKDSIRRDELRFYCDSTFLFESLFMKCKYALLQHYFRKSC